MKIKTKTIILLSFSLILSSLFTGCANNLTSTKEEQSTVLIIDNFEVPFEIYRYCLLNTKRTEDNGDDSYWDNLNNKDEVVNAVYDYTYDALKNIYVTLSLCKDYNISIDDQLIKDKVTDTVNKQKNSYKSTKDYIAALNQYNMNNSTYEFLLGVMYCQDELYYAMINAGKIVTNEDHIRQMAYSDEIIRIKQVLIKFDVDDDGIDDATHEEKLKIANEVLEKAKNGEDFDNLIKKYGNDPYLFNNEDGYYIARGTRYENFEEAAFNLNINEISDIVETKEGYSIIIRLEKDTEYIENNINTIGAEYIDAIFNRAINQRLNELEITETENLKQYNLFNVKMK